MKKSLFFFFFFATISTLASAFPNQPHVLVDAKATIELNPDLVDITIQISSTQATPELAVQNLETDQKTLLDLLQKKGYSLEDLKLSNLSLHPVRQYSSYHKIYQLKGYKASKSMVLCLKQIQGMKKALFTISKAKIESFQVSFKSSKAIESKNQLRIMAMKAAFAKAELLAKEAKSTLGKVLAIKELHGGSSWAMRQTLSNAYTPSSSRGNIKPGAIKLSLTLQVVFGLKN